MSEAAPKRCGFIAVIGAPNAGKSTLVNALVGAKVSIVTPKPQTTRMRIRGIAVEGPAQLVFVDTPGIFAKPRRRLERAMIAAAWDGAADADLVLLVIDAARGLDAETAKILPRLGEKGRQAILVINKVDLVEKPKLLGLAATLNQTGAFAETFMLSAQSGDGVGDLKHRLAALVPPGPWHYAEDQLADLPQRLMAAETTREQAFLQLHQELPYALAVESESWRKLRDGSLRVEQVITVERDSQKAILLGKGGAMIKAIRTAAQAELAKQLDCPVHLFLNVKVRADWVEERSRYRDLDLTYDV